MILTSSFELGTCPLHRRRSPVRRLRSGVVLLREVMVVAHVWVKQHFGHRNQPVIRNTVPRHVGGEAGVLAMLSCCGWQGAFACTCGRWPSAAGPVVGIASTLGIQTNSRLSPSARRPQPPQPTMFLITTSNYKSSNVPCFFTMFFDVSGPDWPTPCFFDHVFHVSGPFLVRIGQHHVFLTMFFEQKALCGSCRG